MYKKADPNINTKARDEFWSKAEVSCTVTPPESYCVCAVSLLWVMFWLQKDEDRRRSDDKRSVSEQRKKEEQDRREREVRGAGL